MAGWSPTTAGARRRGVRWLLLGALLITAAGTQAQTMDRSAGGMTMRPAGPGGMWGGIERDSANGPAERLFRSGRLPGDRTADADRAGNPVGADQVACANCHGRSGQGVREGGESAPPIHAAALAAPRDSAPPRPAYGRASLIRAIAEGLAADGRPLSLLMPRYHLEADAMNGLADYLEHLQARALAATDDTGVKVATVIAGEVDPRREEELTATLRAYAGDASAHLHSGGRRWQLAVWHLHGTAAERRAQLEEAYASAPVAALLGGLGDDSWLAVHQFCEQHALPCLFPQTGLPPLDVPAFYSVYLDKGRTLSGQVLARWVRDHPALLEGGPLVQVLPADWSGYLPASALRAYLGRVGARRVRDLTIPSDQPMNVGFWRQVLQNEHPAALVVWTRDLGLTGLVAALEGAPAMPVFVPTDTLQAASPSVEGNTIAPGRGADAGTGQGPAVRLHVLAHQRPLVEDDETAAWRGFERRQNRFGDDCLVCADAWFAARVLDDALSDQATGTVDTDRLMTRIEYAAGTVIRHPLRPDLGLGMGQRFAGKAGWLLVPDTAGGRTLTVEGGPITP